MLDLILENFKTAQIEHFEKLRYVLFEVFQVPSNLAVGSSAEGIYVPLKVRISSILSPNGVGNKVFAVMSMIRRVFTFRT